VQTFFTLLALVTFCLGAWFGTVAFKSLITDISDPRLKDRAWHIGSDILFIIAGTCALVTAVHNLTQIWIR
jgi:uncharacterized membrane protein HdeD (DUF308 family)